MLLNIGLIVLGLVFLVKGGDFLVDGATAIARKAKVSEMVIGLTIVGFGTSTPELLVSLQAALEGSSGLAIGNVVGSNIANIALILGVTALIVPCPTDKKTVFLDMGVMLFAIFAFTAVALTGTISRTAGIVGFLILVGYVIFQIASSKTEQISDLQENVSTNNPKWKTSLWISLLLIVLGGVLLIYGAKFLVRGASEIARQIGERRGTPAVEMERIIGLTIVAVGTSLPELFASIMAAVKGKTDMAIGNIIGSVTFNILSVIGLSAAITPIYDTRDGFVTDYALMAALGVILWIFLHSRFKLERWEGGVLLAIYVAYIALML